MEEEDNQPASVSSLRSRFEQMKTPTNPAAPVVDWDSQKAKIAHHRQSLQPPPRSSKYIPEPELQNPFAESTAPTCVERVERDAQTAAANRARVVSGGGGPPSIRTGTVNAETHPAPANLMPSHRPAPRPRPISMGTFSPPRVTPTLRVDSPKSPPQPQQEYMHPNTAFVIKSKTPPPVPPARDSQRHSRPTSPAREPAVKGPPPVPTAARPVRPVVGTVRAGETASTHLDSAPPTPSVRGPGTLPSHLFHNHTLPSNGHQSETASTPTPPPVPIRPEKYRLSGKKIPPLPAKKTDNLVAPSPGEDLKVSPFNTPPSSPEKSHAPLHDSNVEDTAAYFAKRMPSKRNSLNPSTFMNPGTPITLVPPTPPVPPPPPAHPPLPFRRSPPPNPPLPSRQSSLAAPSAMSRFEASREPSNAPIMTRASIDSSELRPSLPPRPKGGIGNMFSLHVRKNSLRGRSASPTRASPVNNEPPQTFERQPMLTFEPPPQRSYTIKAENSSSSKGHRAKPSISNGSSYLKPADNSNEEDSDDPLAAEQEYLSEYPDVSQANRRRPLFKNGRHEINCKSDIRLFAVCGQYVCTVSHSTKVWNVTTGECIMSMNHGETTKITAIAFKPAADVLDEGKVLWLGTNTGELLEVDIPSQRLVETRGSAHTKKEVIQIHRHGYEMWSIDDSGKLQVWAPDPTGVPNLRNSPTTFRIPAKHTFSLVVGNQLWIGAGKNVYVYAPSADSRSDILGRNLVPSKPTGDITCGTVVNSAPDVVFFGHSDGKVSMYSKSTLKCIDVVSVSLYKINSMAGVGDYLWTGFKTGMIYIYDVRTNPWTAIKDWKAHDSPVVQVVGDRTSIWKVDRLQVISLDQDNVIRIWDGMLEEDWLEAEMARNEVHYCNFRDIRALVCTWNAGASKPQDLLADTRDAAFLEEVLMSVESPDLIVFGFQELVDLEDKKITAKTIFKGSKKKRAQVTQEKMSHQYRLWQKQLTKSIEQFMPRDQGYHLVHAADLVGLFTCIFVKSSEKHNIRNVAASTVKRGLGGLHGNKGALVIRFLLDDSSLCFINCHLAAGQGHTISRNNDIAAILESNSLPIEKDISVRSDIFVGGGDGSMILDHEICILNGDLNYRIDGHRDSVIHKVKNNDLDALLEKDQLLVERKRNPGFRLRVFNELPIRFAPTYKYDVGTDNYDTSEKKRVPAWCDRLLYRGNGRIKQLDYKRHEVRVSDHRPVSGSFILTLKTVDPERRAITWERCVEGYRQVKDGMLQEAKIDFLINVCGYERDEAERLLSRKSLPAAVKALQQ